MTEKHEVEYPGGGEPIMKSIKNMIRPSDIFGVKKASPPNGKVMLTNRDVRPINVTRIGATAEEGKRFIDEQRQALTDSVADYQRARERFNKNLIPKESRLSEEDNAEPDRFYVDYDIDLFDDDTDLEDHSRDPLPIQNVPSGTTFDFEEKYLDPGKYGGRAMYADYNGDADPEEDLWATDYTWEYHEPTDQDVIDYKNEMREFAGDSGYWGVHENMRPSEYLQATGSRKIDPKEFRPLNRWKDTDDALGDDIDHPLEKSIRDMIGSPDVFGIEKVSKSDDEEPMVATPRAPDTSAMKPEFEREPTFKEMYDANPELQSRVKDVFNQNSFDNYLFGSLSPDVEDDDEDDSGEPTIGELARRYKQGIQKAHSNGSEGTMERMALADADDITNTHKNNNSQNVSGDWVSQDEAKEVDEENTEPAMDPVKKSFDQRISDGLKFAEEHGRLRDFKDMM